MKNFNPHRSTLRLALKPHLAGRPNSARRSSSVAYAQSVSSNATCGSTLHMPGPLPEAWTRAHPARTGAVDAQMNGAVCSKLALRRPLEFAPSRRAVLATRRIAGSRTASNGESGDPRALGEVFLIGIGGESAADQLAAFRFTPFRNATADNLRSAAFSSLRLVLRSRTISSWPTDSAQAISVPYRAIS